VHNGQLNSVAQAGCLPVPDTSRKVQMTRLTTPGNRLLQARTVPSALDAACDAFEDILAVIGSYEQTATSTETAIVFLLVATQAANGRDALLFAPSLPRRSLHPRAALGQLERGSACDITAAVAGLSGLLASRLAWTAAAAAGADQTACHDAARYARKVHDLLAGEDP
jgi:hypothetical protein